MIEVYRGDLIRAGLTGAYVYIAHPYLSLSAPRDCGIPFIAPLLATTVADYAYASDWVPMTIDISAASVVVTTSVANMAMGRPSGDSVQYGLVVGASFAIAKWVGKTYLQTGNALKEGPPIFSF